tara:strand:- start:1421 stop:1627 length:207 start_codon:yes stop_codon:yes gene_type:complete
MKDKVADIRLVGIDNGCVVSVRAKNAEKLRNWEKLNSPSAKEDNRNSKRGDNQNVRLEDTVGSRKPNE